MQGIAGSCSLLLRGFVLWCSPSGCPYFCWDPFVCLMGGTPFWAWWRFSQLNVSFRVLTCDFRAHFSRCVCCSTNSWICYVLQLKGFCVLTLFPLSFCAWRWFVAFLSSLFFIGRFVLSWTKVWICSDLPCMGLCVTGSCEQWQPLPPRSSLLVDTADIFWPSLSETFLLHLSVRFVMVRGHKAFSLWPMASRLHTLFVHFNRPTGSVGIVLF